MYRDELDFPWATFVQAPVRHLLTALPVLQLCQGTNCGHACGKTHAAVDEPVDTIVMEVWSRSFFYIEKGKASAPEAELFSVYLRIPKSMMSSILEAQQKGIYLEPRSTASNSHDENYRVIWLPQKDRQGADHACRSCAEAKGLVRLRMSECLHPMKPRPLLPCVQTPHMLRHRCKGSFASSRCRMELNVLLSLLS